jgi:alpha-1,6-mannosyltransferase
VTQPARLGAAGAVCAVGAVVALVLVAVTGPSVASPDLMGGGPARHLDTDLTTDMVTVGMWLGLLLAAGAVGCWWLALQRGWEPSVRRIVAWGVAGAATLAMVPPLGSSDILSYAAYGRMAVLGLNPYTTTVADLAARGDPIGILYQGAWADVPAVYGPVAVAVQGGVSAIAGTSMRWFIVVMQLVCLLAFLITAWLLLRACVDEGQRRRVALLWVANPLLVYLVVNSAHIDGIAIGFGMAALIALQRSPALAGVLAAVATATKVSYVLYAIAVVWAVRATRRAWVTVVVAGVITGAVLFGPFLPEIVDPLRQASGYLARESPWWVVRHVVLWLTGGLPADRVMGLLGWVLLVVLVVRLRHLVPHRATHAPRTDEAVRIAALLGTAWLLSSSYALPWYDVMAWAPVLLLPASAFDAIVGLRTAAVSVGYVPGIVMEPPGWTGPVTTVLRGGLAPAVSTALVVVGLAAPRRLRPPQPAEPRAPASSR